MQCLVAERHLDIQLPEETLTPTMMLPFVTAKFEKKKKQSTGAAATYCNDDRTMNVIQNFPLIYQKQ